MRNTVTTNRIKKQITFSPVLYQQIVARAEEVGLNFAEYIRHLLAGVIEEDIPMVDRETEKNIATSMKDYREGKFEEIDSSDEKALDKVLGL